MNKAYYCEVYQKDLGTKEEFFITDSELKEAKQGSMLELRSSRRFEGNIIHQIEPKTKVYKVNHHRCIGCRT